jgi:gluconolactonase
MSHASPLHQQENLERVVRTDAHEGPVYVPAEDILYFTSTGGDIRRLEIASGTVSTIRAPANRANGMTLGLDGRLIVCEQGGPVEAARISSVDPATGEAETVVEDWRGLPFNSPNDVVVARDGSVWFTDPSYGFLQGFRPQPRSGDYVYCHDPATGRTSVVADSFDKPNGIALSPDEQVLYVTDSGANQEEGSFYPERPHHVKAFDIRDGRLAAERVFCEVVPGFPDGIECDSEGRVYVSCETGVQVFDPAGEALGEIELPGAVNFAFGGPDRNALLITTDDAVWAATLDATGAELPALRQTNLRGA